MTKLTPTLDAAITYAAHGLKSFPLPTKSKIPSPGSRGFKDATADGGVLHRRFVAAGPDANIAIATGDGLLILDIDSSTAEAWLEERAVAGDRLPRTWVATSGKGRHIYLRIDRPVRSTPLAKVAGFAEEGSRVKAEGGYVLAPPSVHPDGPVYAWVDQPAAIAAAPTWLLALLDEPRAAPRQDMSAGAPFPEGGRNSGLAAEAGRLRRRGLSPAAIEAELRELNRTRCRPPLDDDEVLAVARSVSRYAPDAVAVADDRLDAKVRGKGPVPTDLERRTARAEAPEDSDSAPSSPDNGGDRSEDERTGWERADLGPAVRGELLALPPQMLDRADGVYLLYPGKLHWLSGEPEGLKSWLAQVAVADALADGLSAAYVDFEGDDVSIVKRLQALGVGNDAILKRLSYHRPEVPMSPRTLARILADVDAATPAITVIDGVEAAMGASGLDSNHSLDFHKWWKQLGRPLQLVTSGPTLVIDHVVKNPENRSQYAAGTGQKLAAVDVHIGTIVVESFGIGMTGRAKLVLHKDRPGALRPRAIGRQLGALILASNPANGAITFAIEPPHGEGDPQSAEVRPTHYMEKVSRALEGLTVGKTKADLKREIPGKQEYLIRAMDALVAGGWVASEPSAKTHVLSSVNPYREATDPLRSSVRLRRAGHVAAGGNSATVPDRSPVPGTVAANPSTTVPPLRGNGSGNGSRNGLSVPIDSSVPAKGERMDRCAACGDVHWLRRRGRWLCGSCGEYASPQA